MSARLRFLSFNFDKIDSLWTTFFLYQVPIFALLRMKAWYCTPPRTPRISELKSQVLKPTFELKMMVKSGLEILLAPLVRKNLPRKAELAWQLSR